MGARWYSERLGRWISADPIITNLANAQSLNRYSYVYNRPVSLTDPSGHVAIPAFDPGVGSKGTEKDDFGISVLSSPEDLYDAFAAGYNPFLDPEYLLDSPVMNDTVFSEYYAWALGNNAWLPPGLKDRRDWSQYWAYVTTSKYGGGITFGQVAIQIATSPSFVVGLVQAFGESNGTQLFWSGKVHNEKGGHWATIEAKTRSMMASGEYEKIYVNKSISTATGGQVRDLRRPDIIGVKPDGSYYLVEVVSPLSQTEAQLRAKCQSMSAAFGDLAVTYDVIVPGGK